MFRWKIRLDTMKDTNDFLFITNQIEEEVCKFPHVVGIHDLIVHDYGPGRRMISLHVEVPGDKDIFEMHDIIDNIYYKVLIYFYFILKSFAVLL